MHQILAATTTASPDQWVWGMTPEAWLTLVAVLLGPILAVQAQKWLERRREERNRKVWIFRELMATRGTRLSGRHVEALNTIELEYDGSKKKQKRVYEAWRSYFDMLYTPPGDPNGLANHFQKRDDLFVELVYEMGQYLGFKFDRVAIKRNCYTPVGHGHLEEDMNIIRKGLAKIFTSKGSAVPVRAVDEDFERPPLVTADELYRPTPMERE